VAELRLILVTPEKTLFDRGVASIRVPLFDGAAGFYPGRAPVVGRLGTGELRLTEADGSTESYFIDGGFVQVKGAQVSVLTNSAMPTSDISRSAASARLNAAREVKAKTADERTAATREQERARKMMSLAGRD
jgi:F-type H+-transporting ATPase subunit epsilon